jgi:hypothetical protein
MKLPSNLLSQVLAFLAACSSPAAVMGADNPPATKSVVGDTAATNKPPMVIQNPDGTITVQKEPPKPAKDTKAQKGLVIPPQVIVPITPAPKKRN